MSLWDLIEAKQRRTARLPILVGDAVAAMAEIGKVQAALQAHVESVGDREPTEDEAAAEAQLRADAQAALDRRAATVVWVELQSLPTDEWDGMVGDLEPRENGLPNIRPVLAPLLAASCVDPEGRDAERWAKMLKRPEWTEGDSASAEAKLFELNLYAPSGDPGKG
jgi:hypothetical protein